MFSLLTVVVLRVVVSLLFWCLCRRRFMLFGELCFAVEMGGGHLFATLGKAGFGFAVFLVVASASAPAFFRLSDPLVPSHGQ